MAGAGLLLPLIFDSTAKSGKGCFSVVRLASCIHIFLFASACFAPSPALTPTLSQRAKAKESPPLPLGEGGENNAVYVQGNG